MYPESLASLRRQLNRIIAEEAGACLRKGPTDLQTVTALVKARASVIIQKLQEALAEAEVARMITHALKRINSGGDRERQLAFAGMEEFRGIPYNVSYVLPGEQDVIDDDSEPRVKYAAYLDTFETERTAALDLLAQSMAADRQRFLALKAGNEFASRLVVLYGDLPLWRLYKLHKEQREAHA